MRSNFGLYSVLGTAPFTVRRWLAIVVLVSTAATASAATLYVDAASTNAVPPFTNWASAAVTIQDAVDAAVDGDEIVVTNGVYQTGARAVYGMSNRVAVTKPVTVRSVNGPAYTSIVGHGPIGENAIRCAYLTNGAVLAGFTLTNGATRYPIGFLGDDCGGAVWCESQSAVVTNCVLTGNAASDCGGAALRGTLNNCALIGNSVWFGGGGGAYRSTLNNCTLAGNFGDDGGGANYSVLNNCILTYNLGTWGGGAENSTLNNCILTRNSAEFGSGANTCTLTNCIVVGNSASPGGGGGVIWSTLNNCIVYYNSSADGEENYYGSVFNNSCTTPAPESGVGNITNAPLFVNTNGWSNLRLQSNSPCINAGNNAYVTTSTDLDGRPRVVDGTVDIGAYEWHGAIRYVSATSTNPIAPYSSWASAAVTIQDAVDAAAPGDEIVVTNGVYQTGARAVYGMSNRVAVTKPVTVRSVNGPEVTTIRGAGPIGENAIRCVYLTNGAMLAGFTLTNGATQIGDSEMDSITNSGGGVWCESQSAVITNCVLAGNSASFEGGGVYSGTLNNCIVASNAAWEFGGGAARSMLNSCTLENNFADSNGGGGAYGSTLNNCTLTRNTADPGSGGGVRDCDLNNCVLTDNKGNGGGGASDSTLNNCTLADNSATSHWSDEPSGGGASSSRLYNCIITGNTGTGVSGSTLNNCVLTNNSGSAGGGAQYSTLTNCVVSGNSGHEVGGGAFLSTLYNCVLTGNWGHFYGGGAFVCTLYNCTLAGNEASYYGGGASRCTLNNCTVVGNFAGREEGGRARRRAGKRHAGHQHLHPRG